MAAASERRKAVIKKATDSKKYVWKKRTLWSYYFEGNVEIPEICIHSINLQCPDEKGGCSRLHAKKSWHWQLLNNNEWYNFLYTQSDRLERGFQIVGTDEVVIPALDPSKTGRQGQELLKLLGTESWKADFNQMKITKLNYGNTIHIRRLSSPSSAKFKSKYSTDFRWFSQQDKNWVEFGHCVKNYKKRSSEQTKSQTTSSEIEKNFQKDQDGSMTVNFLDSKCKINFSKMELVNKTSKDVVPVRRRPKNGDVIYPTVWSYHIQGDVDKAEICMDTDGETCTHGNGCGRLHSNTPWHWQVLHNGIWYNMPRSQIESLEKAYLDAWKDSTEIPSINASKMGKMGAVLSTILGTTKWLAEFKSMTITKLNRQGTSLSIRRLSTASPIKSPNKSATSIVWFFQNKEGIWVEFGSTINAEDRTIVVVQQTSSYDIEKCFESRTSDGMIVNIMNGVYELNFSSMMLQSCNTQETMPVRRRPEYTRSDQIQSRVKKNVALSSTSKEYQEVRAELLLSLKLPEIVSIKRVQNPELWNVFRKRQEEVSSSYGSDEMLNMNTLFHWIKMDAVDNICNHNFEWKHQCPEIKAMSEKGVCFFRSAEFRHKSCSSTPTSKDHRLLVFKVIVGKMQGPGAGTLGKACNATVDNNFLPNRYTKYDKRDYCPAYIIKI